MIGRRGIVASVLVLSAGLVGCGAEQTDDAAVPRSVVENVQHVQAGPVGTVPTAPTSRARPQYLDRNYSAPADASGLMRSTRSRAGTLRIPSLRIATPVDAVGLDHGVMAIPDRPSRIGWLRSTAAVGDRIGASVLSGHVSDRHDVPGALSRLHGIRLGAVIDWTSPRGERHRFVVTGVRRYPRARGVPARLFRVVGPHLLHLVTCTDRVAGVGGGFHYASNLVVTAREVPGPR